MKLPIAREGLKLIKFFLLLAIVGYILGKFLAIFHLFALCSLLFALFFAFFFRDPERLPLQEEGFILSPADGKIFEVSREDGYQVVRIFMSPFNIHIQRAPITGKVVRVEYKKGKFIRAYKENASRENEQNVITVRPRSQLSTPPLRAGAGSTLNSQLIIVKQIAGILARRIICWTKVDDDLIQGQRIGMIALGSQVDLHLPEKIPLKVKVGDRVYAGVTVIGTFY